MKNCGSIFSIANVSLVFMTILQIIMPIMVRFAHKRAASFGTKFHSSSAVTLTEATKIAMCLIILMGIHKVPTKVGKVIYNGFVVDRCTTLKMSVPAIIYFAQTNLYYIALNKLNAAVFTVTYQLRILTIAILATLILRKVFTLIQWGALFICLAGAVIVNSNKFDGTTQFDPEQVEQLIGIGLVLAMCWMSAFSGVYLEKVLKGSSDDLWLQNIRLSSVSLLISFGYIGQSYLTNVDYNFFEGWNYWNSIVCFATAVGGLITAAVLKYADNVRKSFCQSLAICGTAFLSVALGDSLFSIGLALGTVLVVISIFVYTLGGKKPIKKTPEEDVEKNDPPKEQIEKPITLEKQGDEKQPMLGPIKEETPEVMIKPDEEVDKTGQEGA